jgi:hypothetical protein
MWLATNIYLRTGLYFYACHFIKAFKQNSVRDSHRTTDFPVFHTDEFCNCNTEAEAIMSQVLEVSPVEAERV